MYLKHLYHISLIWMSLCSSKTITIAQRKQGIKPPIFHYYSFPCIFPILKSPLSACLDFKMNHGWNLSCSCISFRSIQPATTAAERSPVKPSLLLSLLSFFLHPFIVTADFGWPGRSQTDAVRSYYYATTHGLIIDGPRTKRMVKTCHANAARYPIHQFRIVLVQRTNADVWLWLDSTPHHPFNFTNSARHPPCIWMEVCSRPRKSSACNNFS